MTWCILLSRSFLPLNKKKICMRYVEEERRLLQVLLFKKWETGKSISNAPDREWCELRWMAGNLVAIFCPRAARASSRWKLNTSKQDCRKSSKKLITSEPPVKQNAFVHCLVRIVQKPRYKLGRVNSMPHRRNCRTTKGAHHIRRTRARLKGLGRQTACLSSVFVASRSVLRTRLLI